MGWIIARGVGVGKGEGGAGVTAGLSPGSLSLYRLVR